MNKTIRTRAGLAATVAALCASTFSAPAQAADLPHTSWNFSIDSTANVVAYDQSGTLWSYAWMTPGVTPQRRAIGPAGAPIPKAFFVTNWNSDADGVPDLVVQNQDGTLTYREGIATGGFKDHIIGVGWRNYEITVGTWKKTDKYPSIIARNNATGELFHYGNPSGKGLSARVKIGTGWNGISFNLLDWDKDGNTDVVAKNSSGYLKLYRTNGAGSFIAEKRATIGNGWNTMSSIRAVSGLHGSGTVGLRARDSAGVLHYYQANKSAWATRETYTGGWNTYTIAGN
ncbi:VCBS repeat-containing protein [Arthrobacter sp. ZGTC131]|uniref:FG-GAP repeat domain-containing protein n=1 Tax=Arthrobacter sp. ZGTC131 TaxID=2058898 RepID=UPI000CE47E17|nr:VCBS repeat-containing protein [Arthrobacter sp. ZGTC131]